MLGTAHSLVRLSLQIEVGPSSSSKTKSQIGKQPAPRSGGGAVMSDPRPPLTFNSAGPSSNENGEAAMPKPRDFSLDWNPPKAGDYDAHVTDIEIFSGDTISL